MGRFSNAENVQLHKLEIAKAQLEDAIGLFLDGRFLSAITLAAAADSIFSGFLGDDAADKATWREIDLLRRETGLQIAGQSTKKQAFDEWRRVRNRLKHQDDGEAQRLDFNPFDESYLVIQQANADGDKLDVLAANRQDYENWLMVNIYLES